MVPEPEYGPDDEPEYGPDDIAPGPDTTGLPIRRPVITGVGDFDDSETVAQWDTDPLFLFPGELEAAQVLELLGDQVRAQRRQIAHTMRYLKLAARAAVDAELLSKNNVIAHTGMARQTILDMFKD